MRWESEATSVEWVSCCSQQSAKIKYFFWLETIEWEQVMIHTVHYNATDSEYVSDREREKAIIGKWAENVKQSFAMYNGKWKENEEKNCKIKSNRERERERKQNYLNLSFSRNFFFHLQTMCGWWCVSSIAIVFIFFISNQMNYKIWVNVIIHRWFLFIYLRLSTSSGSGYTHIYNII